MTKPKVVLDTNVYLSAIIFGGFPRKVLKLVFQEEIILYTVRFQRTENHGLCPWVNEGDGDTW